MKTTISTRGFEPGPELNKYARVKLSGLNRSIPRGLRAQTICTVRFTQKRKREGGFKVCTLTLALPDESFKVEESTQHMYTSLDIVIEDAQQQLRDYRLRHRRLRAPWHAPEE